MEQTLNEILREITIIKWGVVCLAVSLWGITAFFLLKEIVPAKLGDKKKEKKPFNLEQMNKDLAAATRPRKEPWDG